MYKEVRHSLFRYYSIWSNISSLCCLPQVLGPTCRKYIFE